MKECNKCGVIGPLSEYREGRNICRACEREAAISSASRRRNQNPDLFAKKQREASKRWKQNNRKKYLEMRAQRRRSRGVPARSKSSAIPCDSKMSALSERNAGQAWRYWLRVKAPDYWLDDYYAATGKPWTDHRLDEAQKYRIRYRQDKEFNLKERLRRQIKKAKRRDGIGESIRRGLRGRGVSRVVEERLGYSIQELKEHIEAQFIKRMNWKAYMDGRIHIDHIVPQSSFNTQDDDEWRECWSLSNLRPMWAKDNLVKRDRRETLL